MIRDTRELILQHWHYANHRNWQAFSALLSPQLYYEVPQTREYVESGIGYTEMFRTWPGEWKVTIVNLICENDKAVCVIDFAVDEVKMTGISIFEIHQGLIVKVTDYWPEPYEPPQRQTPYLKRYE